MTPDQLKQKLLAKWHEHNGNDDALSRAEFTHALIDILYEQRQALESVKRWAIVGGHKLAARDPRHPLIGHLYEFERTSSDALLATDEALKKMGVVE